MVYRKKHSTKNQHVERYSRKWSSIRVKCALLFSSISIAIVFLLLLTIWEPPSNNLPIQSETIGGCGQSKVAKCSNEYTLFYYSCGKYIGYGYCPYMSTCKSGTCIKKINGKTQTVISKLNQLTGGIYTPSNFDRNFRKVYYYAQNIPYRFDDENTGTIQAVMGIAKIGDGRQGLNYEQSADETINEGMGDCEDHAILLQSLLEALYMKTFNQFPSGVMYVVCGELIGGVGHCWNIIDKTKLPTGVPFLFAVAPLQEGTSAPAKQMNVIVDDVAYPDRSVKKARLMEYEPYGGPSPPAFLMGVLGKDFVELESTWSMPYNWYNDRAYPVKKIWYVLNTQEQFTEPDFYKKGAKKLNVAKYVNLVQLQINKFFRQIVSVLS